MAIYTERVVMVNKDTAKMDNDIYIYKGNRNICIQFKIIDSQFKFRDVNLVDKFSPSHGYVTLINPEGEQIATGKAEIENATLKLTVTSGMIDEDTEVGDYTIVIDLYDEVGDSLLTIPPIYNQLHVLKRVTDVQDIPDEVRFVYEDDGNLQTVNIDAYVEGAEIKTINKMALADTAARQDIEEIKTAYSGVSNDFDQLEKNVNSTIAALDARIDLDMDDLADYKKEVNIKFNYIANVICENQNIQEIINGCKSGSDVILANDTYIINDTITISNPINISGHDNTIIKMSDNNNDKPIFKVLSSNCSISNLTLDSGNNMYGWLKNELVVGDGNNDYENVTISNITIKNNGNRTNEKDSHGISLLKCSYCTVKNNIVKGVINFHGKANGHNYIGYNKITSVDYTNSQAISSAGDYNVVEYNDISNVYSIGIVSEFNDKGTKIKNNNINVIADPTININGCGFGMSLNEKTYDFEISGNNIFCENRLSPTNNNIGNWGIELLGGQNVLLMNNYIKNFKSSIIVNGVTENKYSNNINIINNIIDGGNISIGNYANNVKINSNDIRITKTSSNGSQIYYNGISVSKFNNTMYGNNIIINNNNIECPNIDYDISAIIISDNQRIVSVMNNNISLCSASGHSSKGIALSNVLCKIEHNKILCLSGNINNSIGIETGGGKLLEKSSICNNSFIDLYKPIKLYPTDIVKMLISNNIVDNCYTRSDVPIVMFTEYTEKTNLWSGYIVYTYGNLKYSDLSGINWNAGDFISAKKDHTLSNTINYNGSTYIIDGWKRITSGTESSETDWVQVILPVKI